MFKYFCRDCGAEAFVENDTVRRTCEHADSVIIAPRNAVLYGEGGADSFRTPFNHPAPVGR